MKANVRAFAMPREYGDGWDEFFVVVVNGRKVAECSDKSDAELIRDALKAFKPVKKGKS